MASKIDSKTSPNNICLQRQKEIQRFNENRSMILSITRETIQMFSNLYRLLSPTLLDCFNSKILSDIILNLGARPTKDGSSAMENPILTVIGHEQSGKTTFINALLEKEVLSTSKTQTESKILKLYYRRKSYCEFVDKEGKIKVSQKLKNEKIDKRIKQLATKIADDDVLIESVIVGIKSSFLECGIDIMNTPGLCEGRVSELRLDKMMRSCTPFVIYIVNGQKALSQNKLLDLLELKKMKADIEIMFFVTHLDDDSTTNSRKTFQEVAEDRLQFIFKLLQYSKLIKQTTDHFSKCIYFQGASLTKLQQYLSNKVTPETKYHYQRFKDFEQALLTVLHRNFKRVCLNACNSLINFYVDVLTKLIFHAQNIAEKTEENLIQINELKVAQEEVYDKIKSSFAESKGDLTKRLIEKMEQETNSILKSIENIEYPSYLAEPNNGTLSDFQKAKECRIFLVNGLMEGLENVIKEFLHQELFHKYETAMQTKRNYEIRQSLFNPKAPCRNSSYRRLLDTRLSRYCKRLSFSRKEDQEDFIEFINVILGSIKTYLSGLSSSELSEASPEDINSTTWKLQEAQKILMCCNHHLLAEDVCQNLFDDIKIQHHQCMETLNKEADFLRQKVIETEGKKLELTNLAPNFYLLYMRIFNVKCFYENRNIKRYDLINDTSRGKVYLSKANKTEFAEKVVKINQAEDLKFIAEEVYYASQFCHAHLLPISVVKLNSEENEISLYYPLMDTDLGTYLRNNVVRLRRSVQFALQIANAIQYLNEEGIIHGNLNVKNVFVDSTPNLHLSDYGMPKPVPFQKFSSFEERIHVAPELTKGSIYTNKVDIYSFGIIGWYLFCMCSDQLDGVSINKDGTVTWNGNSPFTDSNCMKMPDEIRQILKTCCNQNPTERPKINKVSNFFRIVQQKIETKMI